MSSRKIEDLIIGLQESFINLRSQYEKLFPDRQIILTCTYRSPEEQYRLFAKGRNEKGEIINPAEIVTNCDGIKNPSKHNHYPAKAFDFAVIKNGKALWNEKYYKPAGKIIESLDLAWGGCWKTKDYCHVETKDYSNEILNR
jgi:hypothetical protein